MAVCSHRFQRWFLLFIWLTSAADTAIALESDSAEDLHGQTLVEIINQRDIESLADLIDSDALVKRVLAPLDALEQGEQEEFLASLRAQQSEFAGRIIEPLNPEGYAKVLRMRREGEGLRALLRLDYGERGYNYLDFLLVPDGEWFLVVDFFSYTNGEWLSDRVRQRLVLLAPSENRVQKVFAVTGGKQETLQEIGLQIGNREEFVRLFPTLDAPYKESLPLSLAYLNAANSLGDEALYKDALANLARYHPDDPKLAILLLDHYFFEQNYAEAHRALDRFVAYLGVEDAVAHHLRSNLFTMEGKFADAAEQARLAIALEPELEDPYWALLMAVTPQKEYGQAVEVLEMLEERFGYRFAAGALSESEYYRDLAASEVFKGWIEAHRQASPQAAF